MRSAIRRTFLPVSFVVIASAALCDRSQTAGRSDGIPLTANSYLPVDYRLTSELYRKWLAAQENLDGGVGDADRVLSTSRISVTQPTPERINALVAGLERNERTRRAIESAGLSVRDYVLTTIALYQALQPPSRATVAQIDPAIARFVARNRDEIVHVRDASQFQIVNCDTDFDNDGESDAHARADDADCNDKDGDNEDFAQDDDDEDSYQDADDEDDDEDTDD